MKFVISLGGSIIVPNEIDINFLIAFRELIRERIKCGDQFVLVTGGGMTSRRYQIAGKFLGILKREDLDWLGIYSSRLNAHLLQTMFGEHAYHQVLTNPVQKSNWNTGVLIVGGWKPGWSTDYVAVSFAKKFNIKNVLNLSNIDYVYDKNPRENNDAKPFKNISWTNFRKLVGDEWNPGLHVPFDPIASIFAENLALKVVVLKGTDLKNMSKFFSDKKFKGTVIQS